MLTAIFIVFQFFPSCCLTPSRRSSSGSLRGLSILSQLLRLGEHRPLVLLVLLPFNSFPVAALSKPPKRYFWLLLTFQFFPSCCLDEEHAPEGGVELAFNSFPVAARSHVFQELERHANFQFFPSCCYQPERRQEPRELRDLLSILSQLLRPALRWSRAEVQEAFNSFPVAASPCGVGLGDRRAS